jgi:hypothetical protein
MILRIVNPGRSSKQIEFPAYRTDLALIHGPSQEKTGALPSLLKSETAFSPTGHIPFVAAIVRRIVSQLPSTSSSLFDSHPMEFLQFGQNHLAHWRRKIDEDGYKKSVKR